MKAIGLQCAVCGQMYPLEDRYECQTCGGLLQVIYEKSAGGAVPAEELTDDAFSGLWRYHRMLPLENTEHIVSLGEGNTPLVRAGRIYSGLGMDNFYIKNEFSNPTASFKDRPTSVGISVAKEHGATTVAVASSGNAGVSVAAYAAKAGMRCLACVPQKISGGQRQRISLARAILKDAPIVVLDEATAYADPENEEKMEAAIAELVKGKTLVVIAHKLPAIMNADQICVVDHGKLVAAGKHQDLIHSCPEYQKLWKAAQDSAEWNIHTAKEGN